MSILSSSIKSLVDSVTGGRLTIDHVAALAHAGKVFRTNLFNAAVADDGNLEVLIRPADNAIYLRVDVSMVGDGEVLVFEGTTVSANGAGMTAFNLNRMSALVTTCLFNSGPTITGDGTEIGHGILTGDKEDEGFSAVGGELILAPNTIYLIRSINRSGAVARMVLGVGYYEPDLG